MAGLGDTLKGLIVNNTPAGKLANAMNGATMSANNGHTTSGLDQAMQNHADKVHPVGGADVQRMHLPSDDGKW